MSKVFVILGSRWDDYTTRCLAASIHDWLKNNGFANVTLDNRGAPALRANLHKGSLLLSEHYLAVRPIMRVGDTPISSELDMRVTPPICEFPPSGMHVCAVVGHVNSGKSFLLRTIGTMAKQSGLFCDADITEDYMPGTFGWCAELGTAMQEVEGRLRAEMEIHISAELCDTRKSARTLNYYLEEKGVQRG